MTYVYFVEAVGAGLIKIGKSTNVLKRFRSLTTGCPHELKLLGCCDYHTESDLHARFKHLRTRGEWFKATQLLREFITNEIASSGPSVQLRIQGSKVPYRPSYFRKIDAVLKQVHEGRTVFEEPQ